MGSEPKPLTEQLQEIIDKVGDSISYVVLGVDGIRQKITLHRKSDPKLSWKKITADELAKKIEKARRRVEQNKVLAEKRDDDATAIIGIVELLRSKLPRRIAEKSFEKTIEYRTNVTDVWPILKDGDDRIVMVLRSKENMFRIVYGWANSHWFNRGGNWMTPKTFLFKLGELPEVAKILAVPQHVQQKMEDPHDLTCSCGKVMRSKSGFTLHKKVCNAT